MRRLFLLPLLAVAVIAGGCSNARNTVPNAPSGGGPGVAGHNRAASGNPLLPVQAAANVVHTNRTIDALCDGKATAAKSARLERLKKLVADDIQAFKGNPNGDIQPGSSTSQRSMQTVMRQLQQHLKQCGFSSQAAQVAHARATTSPN